jgi:ABC-2 type transport system permease protein
MEATSMAQPSARLAKSPGASSWRHFLQVTRALAATEFKLRYFGSVLGYVWSVLRPLMLFGVLYLVFTHIVRFTQVPHYPVVLLTAIVLFTFFAEATSGGLTSLVARENLIRKVAFPRAAIPVAVSMTSVANLGIGIVIVFAFALINGVTPSATWILFLGAVLVIVVLATALAVLLAVLYVRFRDVQPIWEVVLQLLFWGTPIFYTIQDVPESVRPIMMSSPLAASIQQARHWLVETSTPSAGSAIGGTVRLLIPFAVFAAVLALSYWAFRRSEGRIAEDL